MDIERTVLVQITVCYVTFFYMDWTLSYNAFKI